MKEEGRLKYNVLEKKNKLSKQILNLFDIIP